MKPIKIKNLILTLLVVTSIFPLGCSTEEGLTVPSKDENYLLLKEDAALLAKLKSIYDPEQNIFNERTELTPFTTKDLGTPLWDQAIIMVLDNGDRDVKIPLFKSMANLSLKGNRTFAMSYLTVRESHGWDQGLVKYIQINKKELRGFIIDGHPIKNAVNSIISVNGRKPSKKITLETIDGELKMKLSNAREFQVSNNSLAGARTSDWFDDFAEYFSSASAAWNDFVDCYNTEAGPAINDYMITGIFCAASITVALETGGLAGFVALAACMDVYEEWNEMVEAVETYCPY